MKVIFKNILISAMLALPALQTGLAQDRAFVPRKVYNGGSEELQRGLRSQLRDELKRLNTKSYGVASQYIKRTNFLLQQVRFGYFIHDDSLEHFVGNILDELVSHNALSHLPVRVLILKSPVSNAYCIGEGTFVVTVGLLGMVQNESELAFALAHELAHYELDHVKMRTVQEVETKFEQNTRKGVGKILTEDDVTLSEVDTLRRLVYSMSKFTRAHELQADSLGLVYMRRAGYRESESLSLFSILDSTDYSKYRVGNKMFDLLNFTKYPFQQYWLKPRLAIYGKRPNNYLIFSGDSLQSHPDIALRIERLGKFIQQKDIPPNRSPEAYTDAMIALAEFESVEAAFDAGQYDYALLLALQLKLRYDKSAYLTSTISRIFIKLYKAKDSNTYGFFVPSYTTYYGEELRSVNTLLNNLRLEEIGELGFHFLNNQGNFNPQEEEHYYLLWQICDLTKRENVRDKIKENYKSRFGKGKYSDDMK